MPLTTTTIRFLAPAAPPPAKRRAPALARSGALRRRRGHGEQEHESSHEHCAELESASLPEDAAAAGGGQALHADDAIDRGQRLPWFSDLPGLCSAGDWEPGSWLPGRPPDSTGAPGGRVACRRALYPGGLPGSKSSSGPGFTGGRSSSSPRAETLTIRCVVWPMQGFGIDGRLDAPGLGFRPRRGRRGQRAVGGEVADVEPIATPRQVTMKQANGRVAGALTQSPLSTPSDIRPGDYRVPAADQSESPMLLIVRLVKQWLRGVMLS